MALGIGVPLEYKNFQSYKNNHFSMRGYVCHLNFADVSKSRGILHIEHLEFPHPCARKSIWRDARGNQSIFKHRILGDFIINRKLSQEISHFMKISRGEKLFIRMLFIH